MSSAPLVSVIIPTYNYAHYLDEAIQSVLNQTFSDFELIIGDNHSTDNTEEVVTKYLTDNRINYIRHSENIGAVSNMNTCLALAKGKYIKFLMADDKFHSDLLKKFVEVMDRHPAVVLVTSYRYAFGNKSKIMSTSLQGLQKGSYVIQECLQDGHGNIIGEPTTTMFRKNALPQVAFDSNYTCLTDLNLWLRMLTAGDCYTIPEPLSYFRFHDEQDSNIKNYRNRFDEYYFYKNILTNNHYNADIVQLNISHVLKAKALKCAKVMYLVMPEIYRKANRQLFVKAFSIARSEKVVLKSFSLIFKR